MTKEHIFRKHFVENDSVEEDKHSTDQSKIDSFTWEDDVGDGEHESIVPLLPDFSEIDKCADIIMDCILKKITVHHFEGADTREISFVIPIECSLHPLLIERFSEQWTLDSRLLIFKGIQEQLSEKVKEPNNRSVLDEGISKALPPSSRKKFSFDSLVLHDDAFTVDEESNVITVEILLHFEPN